MRDYLVSLRKEKGFTQKQLATKLDISESYYNQIENGERQRKMDITVIDKLSAALGVSIAELVQLENAINADTQKR